MADGRVDDHPGRFVDDNQLGVLVNDVERDRLTRGKLDRRVAGRQVELYNIAFASSVGNAGGTPVEQHLARPDEAGGGGPAETGDLVGQEAVDPPRRPGDRQPHVPGRRRKT
jgi:hypothetical protein